MAATAAQRAIECALQTGGGYDDVLAAARWADDRGLACFALADHYLGGADGKGANRPAYDAFPLIAGLARETTRIRLAVLVAPITFRHLAVLG